MTYGGASRGAWQRMSAEPGFGADWKEAATQPGPWRVTLRNYGECLPYFDNQVSLNRSTLDAWGLPTLRIDARFRENEATMRKDMGGSRRKCWKRLG